MYLTLTRSMDLASPSGRRQPATRMASAAYYADRLSSSRQALREAATEAANGAVDRKRCYGFDGDGVTILEAEAEVTRELRGTIAWWRAAEAYCR